MKSLFSSRHQGDGKGEQGASTAWPSQGPATKLLCAQAGAPNASLESLRVRGLKHNHIPSFLVLRSLNIGLVICFLTHFCGDFQYRTAMVL